MTHFSCKRCHDLVTPNSLRTCTNPSCPYHSPKAGGVTPVDHSRMYKLIREAEEQQYLAQSSFRRAALALFAVGAVLAATLGVALALWRFASGS